MSSASDTTPTGPRKSSTEFYVAARDATTGCEAGCRIVVTTPGALPDLSSLMSRVARDVQDLALLAPPRTPMALDASHGRWAVVGGPGRVVIGRWSGPKKIEACTIRAGQPTRFTQALLGAWLRARGITAPSVRVTERHLLVALKQALADRVTVSRQTITALEADVHLRGNVESVLLQYFPAVAGHISSWRAAGRILQ